MKRSIRRIRRGLQDLRAETYRERLPLSEVRVFPLGAAIPPEESLPPGADSPGWRPFAPGARWGGRDQNIWFHGEVTLPERWLERDQERYAVALRLLLGTSPDFGWPEGLLYINGQLLQGINQHHPDVLLPDGIVGRRQLVFDARVWSGLTSREHRFEYAEVALVNRDVEALCHLLSAGADLVDALGEQDPLAFPLTQTLESAYDRVDLRRPRDVALDQSSAEALAWLRQRLAALRAEHDPATRPRVTAVGHGHLDVAWLWQTRHTREKAARTFSVATALMDLYPEYHFLHTTPQVFAWLERDYPEVFERVRRRVTEGRFEAAGALWVESDTNLVSGESLVRQIMYGQRYLRETFGSEYDVLWLPDTFGYSYALPQIILKSGLRAFMTTKMSWSDTNRMPFDTFRWRGLDGSETLAHFVTTPWLTYNPEDAYTSDTDTYNGRLDIQAVRGLWDRYHSKSVNRDLLLVYGYGDGGAGPTRQLIENFRALSELPGLPELRLGRADLYFEQLRERVWRNPDVPVWDGELYLEYHRGVYTTQGWLKRLHRRNEERLLLAEYLDAQRWAFAVSRGESVPDERATLDGFWRMLLLHEFHDILPGSSIGAVYEDAKAAMKELAEHLDAFIEQAERDILAHAGLAPGNLAIHNPSPCPLPGESGLVAVPIQRESDINALSLETIDGRPFATQPITTLDGARALLMETPAIAGHGWLPVHLVAAPQPAFQQSDSPTASRTPDGGALLENQMFRVTLDATGAITSMVDKRIAGGRELILNGAAANEFVAFDDRPENFDAWDIDAGYERKAYRPQDASIAQVESGPVRATVWISRRLLDSVIEQEISLYKSLSRVDFTTRIDWRERHLMLKVAFPLDLRATLARAEIQYGSLARPTHRNTSWDQARFEVVAHRWVDVSESGYGVALLNDGKYGHDIHDSTIRLTVLRSPTAPDPQADQGWHELTYSLAPHLGAWPAGEITAHGYALNRPLRAIKAQGTGVGPTSPPAQQARLWPLFTVRAGSAIIETVKRAAEGDDLIVRIYEHAGARTAPQIACALPVAGVAESDLLERPLAQGSSPAYDQWRESPAASHDAPVVGGDGWTCQLRPWEVRTFRVSLFR